MGERRNAYRLLVGKPELKRPLARPRRRWVDNIKDLGETGWGDVDWLDLAQDRDKRRALVNAVMNLRFPYNARKLSSGCTTGGLSSSAQLHRVSFLNMDIFRQTDLGVCCEGRGATGWHPQGFLESFLPRCYVRAISSFRVNNLFEFSP
jgi:hypothetical protein